MVNEDVYNNIMTGKLSVNPKVTDLNCEMKKHKAQSKKIELEDRIK